MWQTQIVSTRTRTLLTIANVVTNRVAEESLADSQGKVTRATLAQVIGERIGLSNSLCNDLVISFFDTIKQSLIAGDTVKNSEVRNV